jgi:hypothetical protein
MHKNGLRAACKPPTVVLQCRELMPTGELPPAVREGYHSFRGGAPASRLKPPSLLQREMLPDAADS